MNIDEINEKWQSLSPLDRLEDCLSLGKVIFSSSFGKQDQMITALIARLPQKIDIFTLDTGRMFNETYDLWKKTQDEYNLVIKGYYPQANDLEEYEQQYGINGFYNSVEARKACCKIRKILPLQKAISGYDYWISGLQRSQSENRSDLRFAEYDEGLKITKLYPLADVSDEDLEKFIIENHVPISTLHAKGFPSIGCSPCTRAIEAGEHPRAGRWWWEQGSQECGLHFVNGKLVRAKGNIE